MVDDPRYRTMPQETMLMDLVQRLSRFRAGRVAVHLHFSELSAAYRRERYLRMATDNFSNMVSGFEGHLFQLSDGDLFFIAKDVTVTMLEASVSRVRTLFSQDPLLESYDADRQPRFCTWYDVEKDYEALFSSVQELVRRVELEKQKSAAPLIFERTPICPEILSRLEQSLETVDVTNVTRRQTVCTLIEDMTPQPLFEELYISIGDLQEVVAPDINIGANTWLFRYLTQTLDHRVMLMLIRDGIATTRPFSLNLNVDTILSPDFAKFEAVITPQLRGRLVIELNKLDVFSDMGAFLFARDYLHDHGFRLCLDGVTHHTLPYYNRDRLGFDLVKLNWTPNALDDMLPSMLSEIRRLVMETGQAHTILCRCDDDRAVTVGHDLGIVMFQGRQIDRLLAGGRSGDKSFYSTKA